MLGTLPEVPQGLKPGVEAALSGTAEAVPFQSGLMRQLAVSSLLIFGFRRRSIVNAAISFKMSAMASAAQLVAFRRVAGHNWLATTGVVLVAVFVLCALFSPWVAPQDPARINLPARLMGPSASHCFGTDELGRDIFSRIIYGARISMLVGSCVVTASLTLGLIFGSIAGYYGGLTDRLLNMIVMNAFMSFPGLLLAIAFVAFLGPGIFNLIFALSLGGWVGYARLVRAQVLAVREREFVEAARALGASDVRIVVRHIWPNIIQPVIVQAAIGMAGAILAEATMSFLGLGVPPPTASWGSMLNDARSHLFDSPHLVLFPAAAVMLAVLSFNFIGDGLRDYLDPRSRIEVGL
jgi:peptide/nickel transport system permease protein